MSVYPSLSSCRYFVGYTGHSDESSINICLYQSVVWSYECIFKHLVYQKEIFLAVFPFFEYRGNAQNQVTATGLLASITRPYVERLHSKQTRSNFHCCNAVASPKPRDTRCRGAAACWQLGAGGGLAGRVVSAQLQVGGQGRESPLTAGGLRCL